MSSFEWMELQTLTSEIATARSRLTAARSSRNVGRARALEEEIGAAETRRTRLLASITINLAATPDTAPARPTSKVAMPVDEAAPEALAAAPMRESTNGGPIMWERLTPADLAHATGELDTRRADALKRHAAELRDLDAERTQVESLEEAIDAFMRKFNPPGPAGAIAMAGRDGGLALAANG
jgi:hypothetical protein